MRISDREFIAFLYEALFDREDIDASDVSYWCERLRAGEAPIDVCRAFVATPEGRHRFFGNQYFEQYFDSRSPELAFHRASGIAEHLRALKIVDVGAMRLAFEKDIYRSLIESELCKVVGFEPIDERRRERAEADPGFELLPFVVGDGSMRQFFRTTVDATSSIYEPNLEALARFSGLAEYHEIAAVEEVQTVRLDDLEAVAGATYMKMDVQGAELDVLSGAPRLLASIPIVHVEVSFFPMYSRQPLAADVDAFLRERGFELFNFTNLERYYYRAKGDPPWPPTRLLWADAVYLREHDALLDSPMDVLIGAAWVMHEVYRAYDLVWTLLTRAEERGISGIGKAYESLLLPAASTGEDRRGENNRTVSTKASGRVTRRLRSAFRGRERSTRTMWRQTH